MILHEECIEGNYSSIEKLRQACAQKTPHSHVKQVIWNLKHCFDLKTLKVHVLIENYLLIHDSEIGLFFESLKIDIISVLSRGDKKRL